MSNTNGNGAKPIQIEPRDLATLELTRSVRDIHGNKTDRFRQDQARWTLGHHRVLAAEIVNVPKQSPITGAQGMEQVQRLVPVYELHWEIVQELGDRALIIRVPYADAVERIPLEIVEFKGVVHVPTADGERQTFGDADDSKTTRQLATPPIAAMIREELVRRAKLVRGEAAEH